MAKTTTRLWDPAEHFESEQDMAAYLEAALEEGDASLVAAALGDIARAKGVVTSPHTPKESSMQKVSTLIIERFRALRRLELQELGRVNLLTGRNNTGKSSILEALRILAADAAPAVLLDILRSREEDIEEWEDPSTSDSVETLFHMSSLFHGFPQASDHPEPIVIQSANGKSPIRLALRVEWIPQGLDAEAVRHELAQGQLFEGDALDTELLPVLFVEGGGRRRRFPRDFYRRFPYRRPGRLDGLDEPHFACIFVSPYGGERTGALGPLWDKIALSDVEGDVVEALRIIDPEISAVSMVGGEGPRRERTAIVRTVGFPRPVPLRSFGDGLNRLFGIALSLVNAKGGLLLIDEFENGLHHTVQLAAWRIIFRLAKRLDIQVFATSHSWDAIEAFQQAAAEDPEEGVLIRLSRQGEDILPTLFREDELAIVTREGIEVR